MTSGWIDAHCHLSDPRLTPSFDQVMERARAAGVTGFIQGGVDPADWERQKELKSQLGEGFLTSFGLHPWRVAKYTRAEIESGLRKLETEVIAADALGETGLDKARERGEAEPFEKQTYAFQRQVKLAREIGKPLILHVVQAHEEAIRVLRLCGEFKAGGMIHSFSGSYPTARQYVDLGFLISICGSVTQEGRHETKAALRRLPKDCIVIETDAPDQTPHLPSAKGKLNEPANLIGIADAVAKIRGETLEEVLRQSNENLKRVFKGLA